MLFIASGRLSRRYPGYWAPTIAFTRFHLARINAEVCTDRSEDSAHSHTGAREGSAAVSHSHTGPREGCVAASQQLPRALWRKCITVEHASSAISLETIAVVFFCCCCCCCCFVVVVFGGVKAT